MTRARPPGPRRPEARHDGPRGRLRRRTATRCQSPGDHSVVLDGTGQPLCIIRDHLDRDPAVRPGRRAVRLGRGRGRPLARVVAGCPHPVLRLGRYPDRRRRASSWSASPRSGRRRSTRPSYRVGGSLTSIVTLVSRPPNRRPRPPVDFRPVSASTRRTRRCPRPYPAPGKHLAHAVVSDGVPDVAAAALARAGPSSPTEHEPGPRLVR